ncbi:hypothetical protein [Arthrobacter sp.]|uniref:hypothetical protein n=1 Tax=Arthrobacter sp. TaxID=1667 RepID=UPI003A8D2279
MGRFPERTAWNRYGPDINPTNPTSTWFQDPLKQFRAKGCMMKSRHSSDGADGGYRRNRLVVNFGKALMALGILVGLSHWIAHIAVVGGPPGVQDLLIGYPTAGLLVIVGAVMAGQTHGGNA